MPFTPKNWEDSPSTATPVNAVALEDMETRVAAYADTVGSGYQLAAAPSAGAASITLDHSPAPVGANMGFVVIDPFTVECEVHRVGSITTGTTLNLLAPLYFAHATSDRVFFVQTHSFLASWWGAQGNGSGDDEPALQQAARNAALYGLWLEGENRIHRIARPLLAPSSAKWKQLNLQASPTFAPVDANGAMVMNMQGNILSFTAAASTDTFTTPAAHGIPADGIKVAFKAAAGGSLPTGVVAGRVYYAYNRTTFTFTVSATLGGATLDLTADGLGTAYCEVISQSKLYFDDVYITGSTIAGINGVKASLQQPASLRKTRIDNCPGEGLWIDGQQADFENFETIACGTGLALDNASFMYFDTFNAEQCETAIKVKSGGAYTCSFRGIHLEMLGGATTRIGFDLAGGHHNLLFDHIVASFQVSGQRIFYQHSGSAGTSSYTIRDLSVAGMGGSAGLILIQDDDRSLTLDSWDDYKHKLVEFQAPLLPASQSYPDPNPLMVAGPGGRYIKYGSTVNDRPTMALRPASAQTADQLVIRDSAAADRAGFNKAGTLFTKTVTAPADADLVNGQAMWWFDQTAGAIKFKSKDSSGVVRTHTLTGV